VSDMDVRFVLMCPEGAASCLARMREVLDCIDRLRGVWPPLDRWRRELPAWFVGACADPLTREQAQAWVERWREMSPAEQVHAEETRAWSLPNWLYWMEPDQSVWRLAQAIHRSDTELEVDVAVDGRPVALGAFYWLARASGARSVEEEAV